LANVLSVLAVSGPSHHSSAGPISTSASLSTLIADECAVRMSTEIGWRAGEAFSRYLTADCMAWRGDYARALVLAHESLAIAVEIEHREWQCGAHRVLGFIALDLCSFQDALAHLEAAHDVARRLGSATWIRWTGGPLAIGLVRRGHLDRAATVLDEVELLVPATTAGGNGDGVTHRTLGERHLELAWVELALARGAATDALRMLEEFDLPGTPRAAICRGRALAALERWEEATDALSVAREGAARQGARSLLWRIDAVQGAVHLGARQRSEARRAFDRARASAAEIVAGLDDARLIAGFWAGVDELAPPPPVSTARRAAKDAFGGLTRRERDTAMLIAQGKSNRAIARTLGIGERTVEGYVAAALAKLGFSSRAQIAVWASERRLAPPVPPTATGKARH
jgi:DNA-binding CsgD family transcriptional regulator